MEQTEAKIKLLSKDGKEFEIARTLAEESKTLKDMLDDLPDVTTAIPLESISSETMEKIIEYLQKAAQDPPTILEHDTIENEKPWETEFMTPMLPNSPILFDLTLASNFLDIKTLYRCCTRNIAKCLRNKSPEEIRATYNLDDDLSPEEKEQIKKENAWFEEN